MPMPPPKASTEVPRDRHFHYEISQIVRALHVNGKLSSEELCRFVGADHWESGVFDCALRHAERDGLVNCGADGSLAAS
jgi:hypothetical protein